jgi:ParB family chromosome partitioning protein
VTTKKTSAKPTVASSGSGVTRALRAGQQQFLAQKQKTESEYAQELVHLDEIKPRETKSRGIDPAHVKDLAASIGRVGLINPLTLAQDKQIVAGHHRREALVELRDNFPDIFELRFPNGLIPIRRSALGYETKSEELWDIELAENERRKNYTPKEVTGIMDYLSARYSNQVGRPTTAQGTEERFARLHDKVQEHFRVSESTARRMIRQHRQKTTGEEQPETPPSLDQAFRDISAKIEDELRPCRSAINRCLALVRDLPKEHPARRSLRTHLNLALDGLAQVLVETSITPPPETTPSPTIAHDPT